MLLQPLAVPVRYQCSEVGPPERPADQPLDPHRVQVATPSRQVRPLRHCVLQVWIGMAQRHPWIEPRRHRLIRARRRPCCHSCLKALPSHLSWPSACAGAHARGRSWPQIEPRHRSERRSRVVAPDRRVEPRPRHVHRRRRWQPRSRSVLACAVRRRRTLPTPSIPHRTRARPGLRERVQALEK